MNYLGEIIDELILNQQHIWCDSKLFWVQALNWEHLYGGNTSVKYDLKNNLKKFPFDYISNLIDFLLMVLINPCVIMFKLQMWVEF